MKVSGPVLFPSRNFLRGLPKQSKPVTAGPPFRVNIGISVFLRPFEYLIMRLSFLFFMSLGYGNLTVVEEEGL